MSDIEQDFQSPPASPITGPVRMYTSSSVYSYVPNFRGWDMKLERGIYKAEYMSENDAIEKDPSSAFATPEQQGVCSAAFRILNKFIVNTSIFFYDNGEFLDGINGQMLDALSDAMEKAVLNTFKFGGFGYPYSVGLIAGSITVYGIEKLSVYMFVYTQQLSRALLGMDFHGNHLNKTTLINKEIERFNKMYDDLDHEIQQLM